MNALINSNDQPIVANSFNSRPLLEQWQSQRRLTRQLIETFPEDEFFNYRLGGMQSFSEMTMELLTVAVPGLWGMLTGEWKVIQQMVSQEDKRMPASKAALLRRWDQATELINTLWFQIPSARFLEMDKAFGETERTIQVLVLSWIDNEILLRAQAFVYLSTLGIKWRSYKENIQKEGKKSFFVHI